MYLVTSFVSDYQEQVFNSNSGAWRCYLVRLLPLGPALLRARLYFVPMDIDPSSPVQKKRRLTLVISESPDVTYDAKQKQLCDQTISEFLSTNLRLAVWYQHD